MKIDPEKEYSLLEIVGLGVLGKGNQKVASAIWHDKYAKDVLQTVITGHGKGVRYRIKGSNLLKYLAVKV